MNVYQCEDSLEGIFTAIYNIYEDKSRPEDTRIDLTGELLLFARYVSVATDKGKALKVMNTLRRRFGEEDYMKICFALASTDEDKAQVIYKTVAAGLAVNCGIGHLCDNLADDSVHKLFSLFRNANNEFLHLRGFVRFQELDNGVLYSRITPKNNVLTFLMPHFADRFPMENFLLYDAGRNLFGIHPAGEEWYLMQDEHYFMNEKKLRMSERESTYQELFRYFCHRIAIKERRNTELQRNMLPLRFREDMVEFR
ncbi:MAG: DNA metabolism protein [Lachnospiraceae bacterium]|nr:DNA metabolism protein [Lachnospiraceae bacterium]